MKKSAKMKTLLESANKMLADDTLSQDTKKGIALMIEVALTSTCSYAGYNFIKKNNDGSSTLLESIHEGKEVNGYKYWNRFYFAPKGGF